MFDNHCGLVDTDLAMVMNSFNSPHSLEDIRQFSASDALQDAIRFNRPDTVQDGRQFNASDALHDARHTNASSTLQEVRQFEASVTLREALQFNASDILQEVNHFGAIDSLQGSNCYESVLKNGSLFDKVRFLGESTAPNLTYGEVQHLLACATRELQKARATMGEKERHYAAKVRHLQNLLESARRERDELLDQNHQLHERLSRSSSFCAAPSESVAVVPKLEAVSNMVQPTRATLTELHRKLQEQQQQQQSNHELEPASHHIELQHQSNADNRLDIQMSSTSQQQLEQQYQHHIGELQQEDQKPEELRNLVMPSPDNQSSSGQRAELDHLYDKVDEWGHFMCASDERGSFALDEPSHGRCQISQGRNLERSPSARLEQFNSEEQQRLMQVQILLQQQPHQGEELQLQQLQMSGEELPRQQQNVDGLPRVTTTGHIHQQASVRSEQYSQQDQQEQQQLMHMLLQRQQHRDEELRLDSQPQQDEDHRSCMLQAQQTSDIHMQDGQPVRSRHSDGPAQVDGLSMSALQHPSWQITPGSGALVQVGVVSGPPLMSSMTPVSHFMPISTGMSSQLLSSSCLQSGSAVASILTPLERLPSSGALLPPRTVHLPEPPEADIQIMLKSLPEKGKLVAAVRKAGPLLKHLLEVGPLPQWKNPPPAMDCIEIPRINIGPGSSMTLPPLEQSHLSNVRSLLSMSSAMMTMPTVEQPNMSSRGRSSFLCGMDIPSSMSMSTSEQPNMSNSRVPLSTFPTSGLTMPKLEQPGMGMRNTQIANFGTRMSIENSLSNATVEQSSMTTLRSQMTSNFSSQMDSASSMSAPMEQPNMTMRCSRAANFSSRLGVDSTSSIAKTVELQMGQVSSDFGTRVETPMELPRLTHSLSLPPSSKQQLLMPATTHGLDHQRSLPPSNNRVPMAHSGSHWGGQDMMSIFSNPLKYAKIH